MSNESPINTTSILNLACQICLQSIRQPTACPNGHCFCSSCLIRWEKPTCPTCRITCQFVKLLGFDDNSTPNGDRLILTSPDYKNSRDLRKVRIVKVLDDYEIELAKLETTNQALRDKLNNCQKENKLKICFSPAGSPSKKIRKCPKCGWVKANGDVQTFPNSPQKSPAQVTALYQLTHQYEQLKFENKRLKQDLEAKKVVITNSKFQCDRFREELIKRSPKRSRTSSLVDQQLIAERDKEIERLKRALEKSDEYIQKLTAQVDVVPLIIQPVDETVAVPNAQECIPIEPQICQSANSAVRKLDFSKRLTSTKTPTNSDLLPNNVFAPVDETNISPKNNSSLRTTDTSTSPQLSLTNEIHCDAELSRDSIGPELLAAAAFSQHIVEHGSDNEVHRTISSKKISDGKSGRRSRGFTPILDLVKEQVTESLESTRSESPSFCPSENSAFQRIDDTESMDGNVINSGTVRELQLNYAANLQNQYGYNRSLSCPAVSDKRVLPSSNKMKRQSFVIGKGMLKSLEPVGYSDENLTTNIIGSSQGISPNTLQPSLSTSKKRSMRCVPNILGPKRRRSSGPQILQAYTKK